jgi:hypothetical protein
MGHHEYMLNKKLIEKIDKELSPVKSVGKASA